MVKRRTPASIDMSASTYESQGSQPMPSLAERMAQRGVAMSPSLLQGMQGTPGTQGPSPMQGSPEGGPDVEDEWDASSREAMRALATTAQLKFEVPSPGGSTHMLL